MDFSNYLNNEITVYEKELYNLLEALSSKYSTLYEAMNYSVKTGGKRLRLIMLIETTKLFTDDYEHAKPFAYALELIHTYSLIHDDLPSLDNSDLRRGKPTNHMVFGDATALLAGDGLLNFAYEVMLSHSAQDKEENSRRNLLAMKEIAEGAGVRGMILGQSADVMFEKSDQEVSRELVDFIHNNKTAAMFVGAMKAGAILGDASLENLELVTTYAKKMGLAFQILDDILDETGDQEKLGKTVGLDNINKKATYPSVVGIEESKKIFSKLMSDAINIIKPIDRNKFFTDLSYYLINRDC